MKSILNSIGDWIKYLFSNTAVLSIIVKYRVFRFKELIKDNLFLIIDNSASGELESSACCNHLAIYNQN